MLTLDERICEEIAQFRFGLIAPIVCRAALSHGERYELLHKIQKGEYDIPYSTRKKIGLRTLEKYLQMYEKGGLSALKPKKRDRSIRIPVQYLEEAAMLRRENRRRSILQIIDMLEKSGHVPPGIIKRSTLYDYFVKLNIARKTTGLKETYRKYGASYRGEILQGDVHHTLHLPDPVREGYKRQVYLFAWIDDYSRLVFGEFYWAEKLPALENTLKKWIVKYGVPENIYCDNGAVYSSHHLKNICGYLGVNLLHSRPYKPQGKGKCEKFFQIVESSFKSEAMLLINEGKVTTIEELNKYFFTWTDKFYNQRIHSATKQKPSAMWESGENEIKKLDLNSIYEAFLYEEERSVSKTGIVHINTNEYEVESILAQKKITVRYDPYDLSKGVRIFYEGKQYQDATPAKIRRHHKKNFVNVEEEVSLHTGLNFLEILTQESAKEIRGISFAEAKEKRKENENDC